MKITEIRARHHYAYRSGEWARLIGTGNFMSRNGIERWCYVVQWWYDKKVDWWPIVDPAAEYEFRERDE